MSDNDDCPQCGSLERGYRKAYPFQGGYATCFHTWHDNCQDIPADMAEDPVKIQRLTSILEGLIADLGEQRFEDNWDRDRIWEALKAASEV